MPITTSKTEGALSVGLDGVVTIRDAQEIATQLAEVLDGCVSVRVRTAGLRDLDTSILQLLCSLRMTVPVMVFEHPSEEFIAAVDRCGLRRELTGGTKETV